MRFKIFGVTVFIEKDIGKILKKKGSDERIEMLGDIPKVTVLDSFLSSYVWGLVKRRYHKKSDNVRSLIPSIKMFRDEYQSIRGIHTNLKICKEFVDSKTFNMSHSGSRSRYGLLETYCSYLFAPSYYNRHVK